MTNDTSQDAGDQDARTELARIRTLLVRDAQMNDAGTTRDMVATLIYATLKRTSGPMWTPTRANMSLRDYFAAQVIGGLASNPGIDWGINDGVRTPENFKERIAVLAYRWADAMMKEREQKP